MLSIFLKHVFVECFSIHVEGLETERSALRSAKRPMGSELMRKTIRIPDSRRFHHVVSLLHGIGCSNLGLGHPECWNAN
jgi:hypothetical protein